MNSLFGTDGIRGKAGEFPLDAATVALIGRSLAIELREKLGRNARFVIGRDTRESGDWIERSFVSGARSEGAECSSAGVITTPGVAFLAKHLDLDAGVVISASHNPFEDNGIKIFSPCGKKLDGETEKKIEEFVAGTSGKREEVPSHDDHPKANEDLQKIYLDHLRNQFNGLSAAGIKIVLDCANGAASSLAPDLFRSIGAEVIAVHNSPDGKNINRDCGSLHIAGLQKLVVENNADLGVSFDGDADRSLFVDGKGNFVDGDAILWIMAQHLRLVGELANDTVVATVMSNIGLEKALSRVGIKLTRTAVGDKYVLRELLESAGSLGGEQSGHIIFPQKSLVGDGMFTALFLLEAIRFAGSKPLSEMTDGFVSYPQVLYNVHVGKKIPFDEVPEICEAAAQIETELGEKGRLLLRYSGTENLARVMIEGDDQAKIEAQAKKLSGIIKKVLS